MGTKVIVSGVEVIVSGGKKWLNEKYIETQLGHANLPAFTLQYPPKLRKQRQELQNYGKNQPCRRYFEEGFAIQIIMDCRTTQAVYFRTRLRFNQYDPIMNQEQSILSKIVTVFADEEIILQYHVLGYRIDVYYFKFKLAIKVDEQGHNDRNIDYEIERQKAIENELGCEFIRINSAKENFSIFVEIVKIQSYITKSTKKLIEKSTKKSLIEELSNKLLILEFKSNNPIKTKCLKYVIKKILPNL